MKTNQESKIRIAKRTRLGRLLCRLASDRTGAVMMEYVILAVLIAAAASLAAIYFGKAIVGSFTTATHATTGQTDSAKTDAKANQDNANTAKTASENARKDISGGSGANDANK